MYPEKQIILYEYQRTRNTSHPREFLRDYSGICVTDGYQVYHTLEKEHEDLTIAGAGSMPAGALMKHCRGSERKPERVCFIPDHKADPGNLPGGRKTQRTFRYGDYKVPDGHQGHRELDSQNVSL